MSEPTIYACAGPDDCSVPCDLKMVALADYERLTRELEMKIERLTRTTVNQRNELARLTFDNNHNFKATAKLQIEIERLTRALADVRMAVSVPWYSEVLAERDRLRAALEKIAKGEGPFSRDNYQFACNVIEESKRLAREALEPKP